MNILFVSNKMPYPPKDGGSIATFQHMWGLASLGQTVTVLTINSKKHFFDVSQIPVEIRSKINFKTFFLDTSLSAFDALKNLFFSSMPYNAERFVSEGFEKYLIEILSQETFDVVQLEGLYLCPYIETIRKYSKALISYRAHNIEHEIWKRRLEREKNHMKGRYLKLLTKRLESFEKSFINSYDLIVPITLRDAKQFTDFGNTKPMLVSPTGIDAKKYEPKPEMIKFPSVFHLGALDWFPNQEALLWFLRNVWRYISKDYTELKFYIAGRNAPKSLIDEFKKFRNIVFVGEVEDAHEFLNSHSILVVPLLSGGGMRVKVVEGMALAKTIVSTPIGVEGIPVTVGKEVLIATTPDEFIYCIEKLVTDKAFCEEIGQNALSFVRQNFDCNVITQQLFDFYSKQLHDN
jgi:glycosyltransferase involved in cell wall biosynthesis